MALIVYKSSAGSGKTTTLVNTFLGICFRKPEDVRHILAITFTNKAAGEMKERILATLQAIIKDDWKSDSRIRSLFSDSQLPEDQFVHRAKHIFHYILHRFDDFNVSTIDSFVHGVIRSFAREVALPSQFEVILDNEDLVPDILSGLYQEIGHDRLLTEIMTQFVLGQAEEDKSPDPTALLEEFIAEQLDERRFIQSLNLQEYTTNDLWHWIKAVRSAYFTKQSTLTQLGKRCLDLFDSHRISINDLSYGKTGLYSYFQKLSNTSRTALKDLIPGPRILQIIGSDTWHSKQCEPYVRDQILMLRPEILELYHQAVHQLQSYILYALINKRIYSLALMHEIRRLFDQHTTETGKLHISAFNKLVYEEVADQPVPFIYERTGKKFRYFLIDEFQDTSVLQWNNMIPLLEEALANGNDCMLVGDAKQAIYRFRNGESALFTHLPGIYGNDGSPLAMGREQLFRQLYKEIPLKHNWRSHTGIVDFNNRFFRQISHNHHDVADKTYEGHWQETMEGRPEGGLVETRIIELPDAESIRRAKTEAVIGWVDFLLNNGYQGNDIAILCRSKATVQQYASALVSNNKEVLSEESLLLINSPEVRSIAAFFSLMESPSDTLQQVVFFENIRQSRNDDEEYDAALRAFLSKKHQTIHEIIDYIDSEAPEVELTGRPYTEIADYVLKYLIRKEKPGIMLQQYYEFLQSNLLPLNELNRKWEKKKQALFIATPENKNAIQVMTIHKSKGLAFEAVITDPESTRTTLTREEVWVPVDMDGMEGVSTTMLPLTQELDYIGLGEYYEQERNATLLDNLNMWYVAFTRPKRALFILASKSDKGSSQLTAELSKFTKEVSGAIQNGQYTEGVLPPPPEQKHSSQGLQLSSWYYTDWRGRGLISSVTSEPSTPPGHKNERDYGNLIHGLMSKVRYAQDVEIIIGQKVNSGLLGPDESKLIRSVLDQVVLHPALSKYYEKGIWFRNETELMLNNGDLVRPDRIVRLDDNNYTIIDYKTGISTPEHIEQMTGYLKALEATGIVKAKALLVYISDEINIESVTIGPSA